MFLYFRGKDGHHKELEFYPTNLKSADFIQQEGVKEQVFKDIDFFLGLHLMFKSDFKATLHKSDYVEIDTGFGNESFILTSDKLD